MLSQDSIPIAGSNHQLASTATAWGHLLGFTKVTRDLTERRRAEERVQELNRQLRQQLDELGASKRALELRTAELHNASLLNYCMRRTLRDSASRENCMTNWDS